MRLMHIIVYIGEGRNSMISRGDVFFCNLSCTQGSEQGGIRPVLVIQNDTGNKYSPTVIVAAITSSLKKRNLPTHIVLEDFKGLSKKSIVLLEQIRTLDKRRLKNKIGRVSDATLKKIDEALLISMGFRDEKREEE